MGETRGALEFIGLKYELCEAMGAALRRAKSAPTHAISNLFDSAAVFDPLGPTNERRSEALHDRDRRPVCGLRSEVHRRQSETLERDRKEQRDRSGRTALPSLRPPQPVSHVAPNRVRPQLDRSSKATLDIDEVPKSLPSTREIARDRRPDRGAAAHLVYRSDSRPSRDLVGQRAGHAQRVGSPNGPKLEGPGLPFERTPPGRCPAARRLRREIHPHDDSKPSTMADRRTLAAAHGTWIRSGLHTGGRR
jgi:hypothetical protein